MTRILSMPSRDPREQPVRREDPMPGFTGELCASVHIPLIAGDLVNAHFALEQWGQNSDPNRWNHPTYQRAAKLAIRFCSEVCRHTAENASEQYALSTFARLEQRLRSCDTDRKTRQSLIIEHFRNANLVYLLHLINGAVQTELERIEYGQEGRVYEGEDDAS